MDVFSQAGIGDADEAHRARRGDFLQQAGNPVVRVFFAGKRGGECLPAGGLAEVAVFEFERQGVRLQVAALHVGKGFMSANTIVPPEIADTIIAVIIYFTATSLLFKRFWGMISKKIRTRQTAGLAAEEV